MIPEQMRTAEYLLRELVDNVTVPDRSCTCATAAPCMRCEEDQHLRKTLADADQFLRARGR